MHLLVCTIPLEVPRYQVEDIINNYEPIKHITWVTAENGRRKEENINPMIGGMIKTSYRYEEENMLMVKVEGLNNAKQMLDDIKQMLGGVKSLHQYIIPIIV